LFLFFPSSSSAALSSLQLQPPATRWGFGLWPLTPSIIGTLLSNRRNSILGQRKLNDGRHAAPPVSAVAASSCVRGGFEICDVLSETKGVE
jgi:hypothetical protein